MVRVLAGVATVLTVGSCLGDQASGTARGLEVGTRIVGGTFAGSTTRFRALASLRSVRDGKEFSICGGSLIAPNVVLTAAHCVINKNGQPKKPDKIVLSDLRVSTKDNQIDRGVDKVVLHPTRTRVRSRTTWPS
jgi:secreted trypsin-like serine protease